MQKSNTILHCDGASRGNPGHAGIGGFACDFEGNVLFEFSEYIGETTNNVAEYKALIKGLEKISELQGEHCVEVFSDSELMVRQINGIYRVKDQSLQLLVQKVFSLKQKFKSFKISHVDRSQNKEADRLASAAVTNRVL